MSEETSQVINSIDEFNEWIQSLNGRGWLYRGLANETWPVCSAASNRIKEEKEEDVFPQIHTKYIEELIDRAHRKDMESKTVRNYLI